MIRRLKYREGDLVWIEVGGRGAAFVLNGMWKPIALSTGGSEYEAAYEVFHAGEVRPIYEFEIRKRKA